ncbi:TIGR04255 family protein [Nocardia carnea]|uniref:TIGR04255 family protein n=1 Tax=Nocardia carnea TaxID=37328 RepID=UPI002456F06E|nr:TIGR04255 family protein [Nocardia carnea]
MSDLQPRREYSSPPVVEAICQLTFDSPVEWSIATPGLLFAAVSKHYPASPKAQRQLATTMGPAADTDGGTELKFGQIAERFIYETADQSRRLVASPESVSVNALPPYEQWPSLKERFEHAIEIFTETVGVFEASKLSLRYINRIEIPSRALKTEDYFNISVVATHQPEAWLTNFALRSESVNPENNVRTTYTFATQNEPGDCSPFILDIEVTAHVEPNVTVDKMLTIIDELHSIENNEFESSITDQTRELFIK